MKAFLTLLIFFICSLSFSQTGNFWTRKSNFGSDTTTNGLKRERAVGFAIGNYGYIGTGIDTAEVVHNDFWKYDPATDAWTQVATLPGSVRRNAFSFTIGNNGYVGTGINTVNSSDVGSQILGDLWQYNSLFNIWTQKTPFPTPGGIYFATAFSIDSKGYVCGGKMGPNFYSNKLWEYKESIDAWAELQNFPGGVRYKMASFSIGFKAYVGLGADQDMYNNDIWEFSAITNSWTQAASLPSSERADVATFTIGQKGFICMGTNGGNLDDLWEYDPYQDDWTPKANFGGSRRKGAVGFSINGKGYVGTGKGNSGKKASFYEYTPSSVLGIEELEANITVYPNPVTNNLNLSTNSNEIEKIDIYSLDGKIILSEKLTSKIDVSFLNSGVYILAAMNSNGQIISQQKIIKQ
ncbi:MAG: T9SS type A sorting domain-containing protein [Fluviicola sp.]|nr:T9SS type A sorting domain-containing protein [Fluviicola sp.]